MANVRNFREDTLDFQVEVRNLNPNNTTNSDILRSTVSFLMNVLGVTLCLLFKNLYSLLLCLSQLSSSIYNNLHPVSMVIRDPIFVCKIAYNPVYGKDFRDIIGWQAGHGNYEWHKLLRSVQVLC